MASYLDTRTRIAGELSRSGMDSEIAAAILSAIAYYGRRRWWWNESASTVATVSGQAYVALPDDFVELDSLMITINSSDRHLKPRSFDQIVGWRVGASTGQPTDFALHQNRIELFNVPNAVYTMPIKYIRTLPALSADADTNAWLTDAEELIRLHAKRDLYIHKIRNTSAAKDMQAMLDSCLFRMESQNQRRTATGNVRAYYL